MGQTKAGAAKAMETIRKRHGKDFHQRIGAIGGRNGTGGGGFAVNKELAAEQGRTNGARSRKGYVFIKENMLYRTYVSKATGETVRFKR